MQISYLEEFIHVANRKSISIAAAEMHVTQPVLSKHIQSLEKELGAQLFERRPNRLVLTHSGRILLGSAEEVVSIMDRAAREIKASRSMQQVTVYGNTRLSEIWNLIENLASSLPYEVRLANDESLPMEKILAEQTSAIGLIPLPPDDEVLRATSKMFQYEKVLDEPLVALVDESHPFAKLASLKIAQLEDVPLVHISEGEGSESIWRIFQCLCEKRGFSPRSRLYFSGMEFLRLEDGVFLLPNREAKPVMEQFNGNGVAVPLSDEDARIDTYALISRVDPSEAACDFFERLTAAAKEKPRTHTGQ